MSMQNMVPPYPNPPRTPHSPPGTLCIEGSLCCPHITYGPMGSSSNTHMNIFPPSSWNPLKFRRLAWHKWLFGLQSRKNYAHYASFWKDESSPHPCRHCHQRHNLSVHGVHAHCTPSHPLVQAWLSSWPQPSLLTAWRSTALRRDLRIVGRMAVPVSLYRHLCHTLGGSRAARKCIGRFQAQALDAVTSALAGEVSKSSLKPNPFNPRDWNRPSRPV